jgi:hypothetical protein
MAYDTELKLKIRLAKEYKCSVHEVTVDYNVVLGEECVYIKGKWIGYLNNDGELN